VRADLEDQGLDLLDDDAGLRHVGCGPVDRKSLMEKDLRGAVLSSKWTIWGGNGEEAVLPTA
jgi:hypothetical protein